jgi:preprotein translocase subunit SecF
MIKILTLKMLFQKAKLYAKKYWKLALGVIVLTVVYITSRSKVHSMAKTLETINQSHKKEVDAIEKAHKAEVLKIEKARVTLETTMKEVEIKYAEAEKKLDAKKKKQVQKIIKENHDDPDAITEKLASLTGFDIYVE